MKATKLKEVKPITGIAVDSQLTNLLSKLSAKQTTEDMPQLPQPLFDKLLGSMFKSKTGQKKL